VVGPRFCDWPRRHSRAPIQEQKLEVIRRNAKPAFRNRKKFRPEIKSNRLWGRSAAKAKNSSPQTDNEQLTRIKPNQGNSNQFKPIQTEKTEKTGLATGHIRLSNLPILA
jgi:hypothetical protein